MLEESTLFSKLLDFECRYSSLVAESRENKDLNVPVSVYFEDTTLLYNALWAVRHLMYDIIKPEYLKGKLP